MFGGIWNHGEEGQNSGNCFVHILSHLTYLVYGIYLAEPDNTENVAVNEEKGSIVTANQNDSITRLKRAAATAISAAAVKAKFLGDQEEYQIRRLTALMIEKLVM